MQQRVVRVGRHGSLLWALADSSLQESTLTECPGTKFILTGYSKGAMVVHHTAAVITPEQQNAVQAIAVFGVS